MKIKIAALNKPFNGVQFTNETGFDLVREYDDFYLIGEATEAELKAAFDAHVAVMPNG